MSENESEIIAYLALSKIEGLGPVLIKNLLSYCGGAAKVFDLKKDQLLKISEIGDKTADKILEKNTFKWAEEENNECKKNNIHVLTISSTHYPNYLKSIHDAPILLFAKGKIESINKQPSICLVGTRKPTTYGKKQAILLAESLSESGIIVTSGLALGIDTEVHKAVVTGKYTTLAILAHGLDTIYPIQNKKLAEEITEEGVLLTEYPSKTKPDRYNFPARNRILSGISHATIVIESPARGGSLITAQTAFEQNREVYAIPGNLGQKNSEGCNKLIRDNIAKLLTHPTEIFVDLGFEINSNQDGSNSNRNTDSISPKFKDQEPLVYHELSEDEKKILNTLQNDTMDIDQITNLSGLPVNIILGNLMNMEFKGWIEQLSGKRFKRNY